MTEATQRNLNAVFTDTLATLWLTLEEIPGTSEPPVSELSDDAVLELADSKPNEVQNHRLGDLQTKGKAAELTDAERYELLALLQIYQLGQLHKSEALASDHAETPSHFVPCGQFSLRPWLSYLLYDGSLSE